MPEISIVIFGRCKNIEHVLRCFYRDSNLRKYFISEFPAFVDHKPTNSDTLVIDESFDERLSDIISSELSVADCFLNVIEALHDTCRPKCMFHQTYPKIFKESRCGCGLFTGKHLKTLDFGLSIDVSSIIHPQSKFKEDFKKFSVVDIMEMVHLSTVKISRKNFVNYIKKTFVKETKCKLNRECDKSSITKHYFKGNLDSFYIIFNWKTEEKTYQNIVHILSAIQSTLDTSSFLEGPGKTLNLHSIILSEKSISGKTIQKLENKWFQIQDNSAFLINQGRWYDVALYCTANCLFPTVLFYSSSPEAESSLSSIEMAYLERLSYHYQDDQSTKVLKDEWEQAEKISEIVELEHKLFCLFCGTQKNFGEPCLICDFLEGEWQCLECSFVNHPVSWTCTKCLKDRIKSLMFSFTCKDCQNTSEGIPYCRYCPKFTKCEKCLEDVFPFQTIYCKICKIFTKGSGECALCHHKIECEKCYTNNFK